MRRQLATGLMAALLVLAGCSTGVDPGSGTGTVNFYMSDQPGAIEDFDHLNVTVDEVTFVRADGNQTTYDANATVDLTRLKGANASLIEEYDVESGNYTKVFLSVEAVDGTLTSGESADVKLPSEKLQLNENFTVGDGEEVDFVYDINVVKRGGSGSYNLLPVASESGTDVEINEVEMNTDRRPPANDTEMSTEGSLNFYVSDQENAIDDFEHLNATVSKVGFQRGGESGNWTEYDVDNRTVDLTELKGDNATLLETFDLESGNYTKVFIHVSAVDGTLTDGSSADVKLPSEKLQLNEEFRIEENATVDFVYDITVVKRGSSGSYNIKPVASESGTDVPIDDVDARADGDDADERDDDGDLSAEFVGNVSAGENATVRVISDGAPVENATVSYDGTEYTTDANGEVTFTVAENATAVEVTVTFDGAETELEAELNDDADGSENTTEDDNAAYAFQPAAA